MHTDGLSGWLHGCTAQCPGLSDSLGRQGAHQPTVAPHLSTNVASSPSPTPVSFFQVVSCEMIEAVGHEHMQAYFQTLGAMLRPGGKCVIQVGREPAPECFCVVAAITATCPCHVLIALLRYWAKAADAVASCFHSISAACRITNHARACVCTVQVIAQPDERYEAYCKTSDFIREHIFPGEQLQGKGG